MTARTEPRALASQCSPRVLLVGSAMGGGGAESRLRLLAQHLFDGTCDVAVFDAGAPGDLRPSQKLIDLGFRGRWTYGTVVNSLRRALREQRYDAVLSMGLHQNSALWAATRGLSRRPALVLTETTRPDTNGRLDTSLLTYLVRRTFYQLTYPAADLVAANSIDGVTEMVENYQVDRSRIRRLPNIVEPGRLQALASQGLNLPDDCPPSFCMVTRLHKMKHVDTLLLAAAALDPGLQWSIDVVGDGEHRKPLEELAQRLQISARVHFHGWQSNPFPYMRRASATVLCSTYEGFSNTVLESMALGTPVVTSFCSSDAHDMCERGAALGFAVEDYHQLSRHLARLLTDKSCGRELRMHATAYIEPHILVNSIIAYESLLEDAISIMQKG